MAFSGALTLTDLNDFITPSQACIKPVEQTNGVKPLDPGAATTEIQVDQSGSYYEVSADGLKSSKSVNGAKRKLETAQISLNDCLACSGCITSAESVLITLQSHTEVLNFLAHNPDPLCDNYKIPVLSIAPQSLASLAASLSSSSAHEIGLPQVLRRVRAFCTRALGFKHVFDTTFARHIALLEHAQEFAERNQMGKGGLPMLASACPGWVCYAEKTHAEMLPFISRTKSPQQVMGTLVKEWMAPKWGKHPDKIYHVTVMPCYDKKLEASRQDFYNDVYGTRDVDCVITTGELQLMMQEKGWDLSLPVADEHELTPANADDVALPELLMHPGSSSGSYLQSLLSSVARSSTSLELGVRTVRGADYEEYTLTERPSGAVVFRGAKCYGFRNLQNVVRKVGREAGVQVGRGPAGRMAGVRPRGRPMKRGDANGAGEQEKGYDYVEVMACPGGCVNGGGQLRPSAGAKKEDAEGFSRDWGESGVKIDEDGAPAVVSGAKWGDKEWTKKVEASYWGGLPSISLECDAAESGYGPLKDADRLAAQILSELCRPANTKDVPKTWNVKMDAEAEERRRKAFRTQYRAVEGEVVGLAVKW